MKKKRTDMDVALANFVAMKDSAFESRGEEVVVVMFGDRDDPLKSEFDSFMGVGNTDESRKRAVDWCIKRAKKIKIGDEGWSPTWWRLQTGYFDGLGTVVIPVQKAIEHNGRMSDKKFIEVLRGTRYTCLGDIRWMME